jgi:hypothetical protein
VKQITRQHNHIAPLRLGEEEYLLESSEGVISSYWIFFREAQMVIWSLRSVDGIR